ncbi:hypothetical protein FQA39_LY06581 [Lamprigera yunnana]|nr:hypothetical protein FQA39_LY06581 [Lamprigera yunnana]
MADVVQKNLENMANELEEMRRIKLFSVEETRMILKKRKEFEHKIHSMVKQLNNYEDYIMYERCLLKDLRLRRDKHKVLDKMGAIEHKIIKRIRLLYENAIQRFPSEVSLYLAFTKFCKKVNLVSVATESFNKLIKLNPDKPELWSVAANFHANEQKDYSTATIILLKALELHKDSQILYKELITTEISKTNNSNRDKKHCIERLTEMVTSTYENIKDVNFYIDLLTQLEDSSFTVEIQVMIIRKLMEEFWDSEFVWHALAQRERKGFHYEKENSAEAMIKQKTPKAKLEACFAKYNEGLEIVSPEVKNNLWRLYLDFLMELQQDFGGASVLKVATLKAALNAAYIDGALLEKHFVAWFDLITDGDASDVAEKATKLLPKSVELWSIRLNLEVVKQETPKVDRIFKLAVKQLKENALPLWFSILRFYYMSNDNKVIESIYRDAVKQPTPISDVFKPKYIEWLSFQGEMDATRALYKALAMEKPYCKELHKVMSKLESMQVVRDYTTWEGVHKLACQQFEKDVDVWMNYIAFFIQDYKDHPNPGEQIIKIKEKAERVLPRALVYEFLTEYAKIRD